MDKIWISVVDRLPPGTGLYRVKTEKGKERVDFFITDYLGNTIWAKEEKNDSIAFWNHLKK